MFGSKNDNKPGLIKSQNPDIRKLGIVLSNEVSLMRIRNGSNLEDAYLNTLNSDDALEKILTDASIILARGTELLPKLNTDSFTSVLLSLVREIKAQIEILDGYICSKTPKKGN
jgi:hypothetical protein